MRRMVYAGVALVALCASMSGCRVVDHDHEACDNIKGQGVYVPVHSQGDVWCEDPTTGDKVWLRKE